MVIKQVNEKQNFTIFVICFQVNELERKLREQEESSEVAALLHLKVIFFFLTNLDILNFKYTYRSSEKNKLK